MPDENFVPVLTSDALDEYSRKRLERVRDLAPTILEKLRSAGVVRVIVSYDGCGDSGQIEQLDFLDSQGNSIIPFEAIDLTEAQVSDMFYDLLESRHEGWEIDDGAYGDFDWDLTSNQLLHVHNARFTDCDTTETEGP